MFDPQRGDIPASQTPGCPSLPSAVANIPIPANLLTAAWQEAETLLGHHIHLLVGIAVRGHTTGFLEVGGLHGCPNSCPDRGSFQEQPYGTRKRGLTLLRDPPHAWSGCALGLVVLEKRQVWGPCLPHTTAHVLCHSITSPSWLTLPPCFSTAKLPFLKANMEWVDSHNCWLCSTL